MPWSEATPMRKLMMLSGASPKEILDFAARYPRRGLPRSPTRVRLRKDENCYPCVRSEMSPMSPVRTEAAHWRRADPSRLTALRACPELEGGCPLEESRSFAPHGAQDDGARAARRHFGLSTMSGKRLLHVPTMALATSAMARTEGWSAELAASALLPSVRTTRMNLPFRVRRMPASLRTPRIVPDFPAQSLSEGRRRALRWRAGPLSRYATIVREDSGSRSSPRATRAIHSARYPGVTEPSRKSFQGDGSSWARARGGSVAKRWIRARPRASMRALISGIPSRSIQAFVAVLSEGPIIRVIRSFHVGFRPGSSTRRVPEPSAFFSSVRVHRSGSEIFPARTSAIASVRMAILITEADSNASAAWRS